MKIHGWASGQCLNDRPLDRLERELGDLKPLALHPYRSYVLAPNVKKKRTQTQGTMVPHIDVQRRPLETYAQVVGGAR